MFVFPKKLKTNLIFRYRGMMFVFMGVVALTSIGVMTFGYNMVKSVYVNIKIPYPSLKPGNPLFIYAWWIPFLVAAAFSCIAGGLWSLLPVTTPGSQGDYIIIIEDNNLINNIFTKNFGNFKSIQLRYFGTLELRILK